MYVILCNLMTLYFTECLGGGQEVRILFERKISGIFPPVDTMLVNMGEL